jgi:type II secretory pathway component PulF
MGFINKIFHHRWWIIVFIISLVVVGIIIWLRREKQVQAKTVTLPIVIPQEEKLQQK